jgi:hypothetical protein
MKKNQLNLSTLGSLSISDNPRAAKADVTNARELMGDAHDHDFGEIDDDDYDDYGDPIYGDPNGYDDDVDSLALFDALSGDPKTRVGRILQKARNPLLMAGAAGATFFGGRAIAKGLKNRKMRRQTAQRVLGRAESRNMSAQRRAIRGAGLKLNPNSNIPFIEVLGAKLNTAQIAPQSMFAAHMVRFGLDRMASETPFQQINAQGIFAGGNFTCTLGPGLAAPLLYMPIIVMIGINALNGAPANLFNITATLPLINGGVLTMSTPINLTMDPAFNVKVQIFPWVLVTTQPYPVLGQVAAAAPQNIVVVVSGLPQQAVVATVVPGSNHPYISSLRAALSIGAAPRA